ncbi:MAG: N-acetyltransferase [Candidatus Omnitrophica bacterium]|nr:N-acetyltransferase [Candidatus Omnitrophota bacterium]
MIIRQERPVELEKIHDFIKTAFKTARVSAGTEQDLVDRLRAGENYIPELALVAEENGEMVGYIMLTEAHISGPTEEFPVLFLAPICVAQERRNKGLGSQIIRESFSLAMEMGYTAVLLVGDPAYYEKFGFKRASSFGIKTLHNNILDQNALACELVPGVLKKASGAADCF